MNLRQIDTFAAVMRCGTTSRVAEGDTVIAFFDASGPTRDGEIYSNTYAWFLEMKDGRIVRAHAFFDSIVFDAFWRRVAPA